MEQLLIIDCISLVIFLKLSLDDYHFGSRLIGLLQEIVPHAIPPSKRSHIVKYKSRLAHLNATIVDGQQVDKPQVDSPKVS